MGSALIMVGSDGDEGGGGRWGVVVELEGLVLEFRRLSRLFEWNVCYLGSVASFVSYHTVWFSVVLPRCLIQRNFWCVSHAPFHRRTPRSNEHHTLSQAKIEPTFQAPVTPLMLGRLPPKPPVDPNPPAPRTVSSSSSTTTTSGV